MIGFSVPKFEPALGLTLTRVKKPEAARNDVMIRIRNTAICGTDIHVWRWDDCAQKTIPAPTSPVPQHDRRGVNREGAFA